MLKIKHQTRENWQYIVAGLLITVAFLLSYYPLLDVQGFSPKDDWNAVWLTSDNPVHSQLQDLIGTDRSIFYYGIEREINDFRRIRPTYWMLFTLESYLFQYSPLLWKIETLLVGISTAFLFFVNLRLLRLSLIPGLLGCLWLIFATDTGRIWAENQTAEEPAMLLAMVSIYALIQGAQTQHNTKWNWVGLISIGLAGWMKESFILLLPPLVLFQGILRVYHFQSSTLKNTLKELKGWFAASLFLFIIQLTGALYVYRGGSDGYAAQITGDLSSINRFTFLQWARIVFYERYHLAYYLPVLGNLILIPLVLRNRNMVKVIGLISVTCFLWIVPQIFLYGNSGFGSYYIYPAIVGLVFMNVIGLEMLWRSRHPALKVLFAVCVLFSLSLFPRTMVSVANLAAQSVATTNALHGVTQRVDDLTDSGYETPILYSSGKPSWDLCVTILVMFGDMGIYPPVYIDFSANDAPHVYIELLLKMYMPLSEVDGSNINIIVSDMSVEEFDDYASAKYDWYDTIAWQAYDLSSSSRHITTDLRWQETEIRYSVFKRID